MEAVRLHRIVACAARYCSFVILVGTTRLGAALYADKFSINKTDQISNGPARGAVASVLLQVVLISLSLGAPEKREKLKWGAY